MNYQVKTFKMRCAYESEAILISRLLQQASQNCWVNWLAVRNNKIDRKTYDKQSFQAARVTVISQVCPFDGVYTEIEVTSTLTFDELKWIISLLPGHIAKESLKPIADYDGERDNDEKGYSKPNNIRPEFQTSEVIRRILKHLDNDIFNLMTQIGIYNPEYEL